MSGIVNTTGARSGVVGTTVGTPVTDLSTATFPTGHVLQLKTDATIATGGPSDSTFSTPPSGLSFDNNLGSTSNPVLILWSGQVVKHDSVTASSMLGFINGGSFAAGISGPKVVADELKNFSNQQRSGVSVQIVDSNPGTLTPAYFIFWSPNGAGSTPSMEAISTQGMTIIEFQG